MIEEFEPFETECQITGNTEKDRKHVIEERAWEILTDISRNDRFLHPKRYIKGEKLILRVESQRFGILEGHCPCRQCANKVVKEANAWITKTVRDEKRREELLYHVVSANCGIGVDIVLGQDLDLRRPLIKNDDIPLDAYVNDDGEYTDDDDGGESVR